MGLDISHNTWHGAYSGFYRWRCEIAKYAGLPPLEIMEGYYDKQMFDIIRANLKGQLGERIFNVVADQLPIKWSAIKSNGLKLLLLHSDCEGHFTWKEAKAVADALTVIMPNIPENDDQGGHIGNMRNKTQQFIDGLMTAYKAKEKVIFG